MGRECAERESRKQRRLVRDACFRLRADLVDIDYGHSRNLRKAQIAELAHGDWVERGRNLLITGPCGSGKTWIACALGHNACLKRDIGSLLQDLKTVSGSLPGKGGRKLQQASLKTGKSELLIVDDWGLEAVTTAQRYDLMEIMDDRYGESSTVVISQLPVSEWHGIIGDNTVADAILDRIVHNSHRLELGGESMRKIVAEKEAKQEFVKGKEENRDDC